MWGDRDRSKRPKMGDIASQIADIVIITTTIREQKTGEYQKEILDGNAKLRSLK
jgi:UDP-N-acetylmuramyl tripeptide synthase